MSARWRWEILVSEATSSRVSPAASRALRSRSPTPNSVASSALSAFASSSMPVSEILGPSAIPTQQVSAPCCQAQSGRKLRESCGFRRRSVDFEPVLLGPAAQGLAHVGRRLGNPLPHLCANCLKIDPANQLLDRPDGGRGDRQAPDAEPEQRQRFQPPPAHLAANSDVDRETPRLVEHPGEKAQDR